MSTIERRFVGIDKAVELVEAREDEPTKIQGYAAVFYDGTRDTEYELWPGVFERIAPSAFDKVIADNCDTRCLMNHDPNLLLGRRSAGTLKLEKFSKGLRYTNKPGDTQAGRDAVNHLKRGDMDGSSFSFTIESEEWAKEEDGREIRTIQSVRDLYDVGPVTFPAYSGSSAGVRVMGDVAEARSSYESWKAEAPEQHAEPSEEEVQARLEAIAKRAAEVSDGM